MLFYLKTSLQIFGLSYIFGLLFLAKLNYFFKFFRVVLLLFYRYLD